MNSFIRPVESGGKVFDFSFFSIYTVNGVKYFVTVLDGAKKAQHFTIQKRGSSWKIDEAPKVAQWIMRLEPQLALAIEENEKPGTGS